MRYLKYAPEIVKIIEGAVGMNARQVRRYTEFLCSKLESDGEERVARILRQALSETHQNAVVGAGAFAMPTDQESQMPLLEVFAPNELDEWVALDPAGMATVEDFLGCISNRESLALNNIPIPNALLLHGPPGCGKSRLARYIARRLNLPIAVTRLDSTVSSYLGNTAKNLRRVFDYASETPCILFLDEFDAVAKMRDDKQELGELKRVVNSLIQNIDRLKGSTLLIAATNHAHLLDPAIWRRFDYSIRIDLPGHSSRSRLVCSFTRGTVCGEDADGLATLFKGMSGAEIELICMRGLRTSAIQGTPLTLELIVHSYFQYLEQTGHLNVVDRPRRKVEVLYARAGDSVSRKLIARAVGVTPGYVSQVLGSAKQSIVEVEGTHGERGEQRTETFVTDTSLR